jgi:hypothetical protein
MRKLIVTGHSHYGKPTRLTLKFDDRRNLLNHRAVAASSMIGWGEWQQSEKVSSHWGDCWWVSTAGHGGYILVTSVKGTPFKEPVLSVDHVFGTVYVYEFEEDCDWAILEYHDALVRQHALKRHNDRRIELGKPAYSGADYLTDIVIPCLRQWNAWVLPETA